MKLTTKDMVTIALSTTILAVCAFITIPFYVPFTLQTFALFTIIGLFGLKRAFFSVCLYLLLGAVGLPVFSGFQGGLGTLFGVTGGYLFGFLPATFVCSLLLSFFKTCKKKILVHCLSSVAGLSVCYVFGTLWYLLLYQNSTRSLSVTSVLSLCVIPFILPDFIKIILSAYVVKLLKKHMPKA